MLRDWMDKMDKYVILFCCGLIVCGVVAITLIYNECWFLLSFTIGYLCGFGIPMPKKINKE